MRAKAFCIVLAIALMASSFAWADPFPYYSTHTDYVSYVEILPTNSSGATWQYYVTVLAGPSEHGGVAGIKAVAVYPNGGESEPALAGWTDYSVYVRPNWIDNGGWHTQQGVFGYLTGSPANYIVPGQANELVGSASYPTSYVPPDQRFLVHIVYNDDYTYWARPTIIPEPSSLSILGIGLLPLVRLVGRKRR